MPGFTVRAAVLDCDDLGDLEGEYPRGIRDRVQRETQVEPPVATLRNWWMVCHRFISRGKPG